MAVLKKKKEKKKTSILRLTDNLNAIKPMEKATYTYRTVKKSQPRECRTGIQPKRKLKPVESLIAGRSGT